MLSGASARANEQLLYEQKDAWNQIRLDLRSDGEARARYLRGIASGYDWSGRGGSAAWRAERRVEVQDFEDWLINCSGHGPAERQVKPPGWLVSVPGPWQAYVPPAASAGMPEPYATWVAAGRVLAFPARHKQALWPLIRNPGRPGRAPVPGIEPVLAAAAGLRPDQVSGFIEAVLMDWSGEYEDPAFPVQLHLPAEEAFDFGFIAADERQRAIDQARAETLQAMTDFISGLPEHQRHYRAEQEAELARAMDDARLFGHMAAELGIKATWVWPGRSVADEILAGTRADAVQWLARWAYKTCTRLLQQSMEQAWHESFGNRPAVH